MKKRITFTRFNGTCNLVLVAAILAILTTGAEAFAAPLAASEDAAEKQGTLEIVVGQVSSAPGTEVDVPITFVTNGTEPASVNFVLLYDADKLDFVSLQQGPIVSAAGKTIYYNDVADGELRLLIHGGVTVLEDGLLADVTFAIDPAVSDEDTIAVTGDGTENAATPSASRIPTVVVEGSISANVAAIYSLTATVQGLGYVTLIPAGGQYEANTVVIAVAVAETGWQFDHWEGDASGSATLASLTMDGDKNITAVFVPTFVLTTAVQGSGTVLPTAGNHVYVGDTSVEVSATPADGWVFDHWQGALSGSQNPATVTMDADKTVTAVFVEEPPVTFTLTMAVDGAGSVTPSAGAHSYAENTQVPLSAEPTDGWVFDHWQGALSGSQNPTTVIMDADKTITAVFAEAEREDVNGDDALDAVDVQLIINGVLGLGGQYDFDVNNDGAVNAIDIQRVINAVLGI